MKRYCIFVLLFVSFLCCTAATAYANKNVLEFYDKSMTDDLDADVLSDIEDEIREQSQAVIEMNSIDGAVALSSFSVTDPVKVVFVESNHVNDVLDQLGGMSDAADSKKYFNTEDIFESRSLKYSWKVPVMETEDGYLYASVKINSLDDISVSSTLATNKELNDVTYLFDRTLVPGILGDSGLNVNYDAVFPVSLPVISTDIIIFMADQVQYAIPFSARPDLLGAVNGRIYEFGQLKDIITNMLNELPDGNGLMTASDGGGIGQGDSTYNESESKEGHASFLLIFGIVGVIVCTGGLVFYKKRKSRW